MKILVLLAYFGFTTAYVLCAWEHWGTPPPGVSSFLREQVNTNHENSFIELFSAAAWLIAAVLFARAFVGARKAFSNHWSRIWLIFFSILSVAAFGEEISWGTHWTGPDPFADYVNSEWSIHNQGLTSTGIPMLDSQGNVLFYAGLLALWVALPILKFRRPLNRWAAFASMPIPSGMVRLFFILDTIAYLVLDRLLDAAHVYEASIGVVAILSAATMRSADGRDTNPA